MKAVNIVTEPFEFISYLEFECVEEVNEHGILRVRGLIANENVEDYQKIACQEVWVKVALKDENEISQTFFNGVMTSFRLKMEGEVYELTIELKSGSYLMDLVPHIRSFQDEGFTYYQVLKMSLGNGSFIMRAEKDSEIGEFLLQYEETDWAFAKRLASHLKTCLLPEYIVPGQKLYFGIDETAKPVEITNERYTMDAGTAGITMIVESRDVYEVGQFILFKNSSYMIGKRISSLLGEEVCHEYHLLSKGLREFGRKINENVKGLSLKGSVTEVKSDMVHIELDEDENKINCGNRWFPYATVYSTPEGTGWYCMPEKGDKIRLTFPDHVESSAYAASSVHLEAAQERTNPDEKSWKNKYNKEVLLTPNAIKISNHDGLSVELLDNGGIDVTSNQDINLQSQKDIKLCSMGGEISIRGTESVSLLQSGASIQIADDIKITGGKIYMN